MEEFRPIPGYEGFYSAGSQGNIRSEARHVRNRAKKGRMVRQRVLRSSYNRVTGYLQVGLRINGKTSTRSVQTLVAKAFLGPPPPKTEVNHRNGNKTDNRVENLEYVTSRTNTRHARRTGLQKHTPRNQNGQKAHLNRAKADEIRTKRSAGASIADLQTEYGVSRTSISQIINKRTYWP